jgi:lysophospholipase L1-like esterase
MAFAFDLVASAALREMRVRMAARTLRQAESQQEPYKNTSWGARYWEEIERYEERWDPYYVYRVREMHGEFINVHDGVRATYRPQRAADHEHVVFLFGGSAAWGHGVRDVETLPSWLARIGEEHGERLDVRNYAESGWVNGQSLAYLLDRLAVGERPDVVIFYSGVNETLSAAQWPHLRHPIWNAEAYPRAMTDWALERARPFRRVWDYYRGTSLLWSWIVPRELLEGTAPTDRSGLAERIASEYLSDRDLTQRLGGAFGFRSLFVWQLSVADKPLLSAQERRYAGWLPQGPDTTPAIPWWSLDAGLHTLYEEAGKRVKARGVAGISGAFGHLQESAFIDWMHPSGKGNELVARAIYEWLVPQLHPAIP